MDESTGLPALPEGQFWRVARDYTDRYNWMGSGPAVLLMARTVEKKRHNQWFGKFYETEHITEGSIGIQWIDVKSKDGIPTTAEVRKAAEKLMATRAATAAKKAAWEAIEGDYPPKVLAP